MTKDARLDGEGPTPGSTQDQVGRLLAQALLRSEPAQDELPPGSAAKPEAPAGFDGPEATAMQAIDGLCAELRNDIQRMVGEIAEARRQAEADRSRAHRELEQATRARKEAEASRLRCQQEWEQARTAKLEADRTCRQLEADAQQHASQIIRDTLSQAQEQAAAIRRLAAAEMQKMLDDIAGIRTAALEELQNHRLLAVVSRSQSAAPQETTGTSKP